MWLYDDVKASYGCKARKLFSACRYGRIRGPCDSWHLRKHIYQSASDYPFKCKARGQSSQVEISQGCKTWTDPKGYRMWLNLKTIYWVDSTQGKVRHQIDSLGCKGGSRLPFATQTISTALQHASQISRFSSQQALVPPMRFGIES
jgi:hypothetical protein